MSENEKPEMIIKRILEERGIQQKFVCEKIGIPQQLFSYSLRGKRKMQVWEFIAICNLLGLDFSLFKNCFKQVANG